MFRPRTMVPSSPMAGNPELNLVFNRLITQLLVPPAQIVGFLSGSSMISWSLETALSSSISSPLASSCSRILLTMTRLQGYHSLDPGLRYGVQVRCVHLQTDRVKLMTHSEDSSNWFFTFSLDSSVRQKPWLFFKMQEVHELDLCLSLATKRDYWKSEID
jgi:hypothetical protein